MDRCLKKVHDPIFAKIDLDIDANARKARFIVPNVVEARGEPIIIRPRTNWPPSRGTADRSAKCELNGRVPRSPLFRGCAFGKLRHKLQIGALSRRLVRRLSCPNCYLRRPSPALS